MNKHIDALEAQTIYILREAYNRINPLSMLWSIGKDSTALLWMTKKAFYGRVPFSLVHLDTEMELPEVYEFRDMLIKKWAFDLLSEDCPSEETIDASLPPATRSAARKTEGLKQLVEREGYRGLILGIRRDEQGTRAKERVFSPRSFDGQWDVRNQPPEFWDHYKTDFADGTHVRVHPLLHWTELDIWRYTLQENLPIVPLYLSKNGKRYRSLGEKNITFPIDSDASTIEEIILELETTKIPERSGRAMDNETEDSFEKLRIMGYM